MRAQTLVLAVAGLVSGCASTGGPVPPPRSALATRAMQSRPYATPDRRAVFSALVQGVQDAGFQVTQVNAEAGFVLANAQHVEGREAPGIVKVLFVSYYLMFPRLFSSKKHVIVEATGTVADEGGVQRVRIVCRKMVRDSQGAMKDVQEVEDGAFYQGLFARVDKALFLAREGL